MDHPINAAMTENEYEKFKNKRTYAKMPAIGS
jgi:hypothetical protein